MQSTPLPSHDMQPAKCTEDHPCVPCQACACTTLRRAPTLLWAQITFNRHAVPAVLRNPDSHGPLELIQLPKHHFPNWCGGPCGCDGDVPRNATRFLRHENRLGHLVTGRCAA